MKEKIIEIIEIGFPQCLIQREGNPTSELIKTEDLINELWNLYAQYDDAYNHACEYQERAHQAEQELRELSKAYEGHDF